MLIGMTKDGLRKYLLQKRRCDSIKNKKIFNRLITVPQFESAVLVLTYVSLPNEIDTLQLIKYCFEMSKKVAVPRVEGDEMAFCRISSLDELEIGHFGVLEPIAECPRVTGYTDSVCVVPALACNAANHRLGYGKGFYDRFLRRFDGFSIALCYNDNIIDIPADDFDVPVQLVVTDDKA